MKCDHFKRLITLTSDYIKRLSLSLYKSVEDQLLLLWAILLGMKKRIMQSLRKFLTFFGQVLWWNRLENTLSKHKIFWLSFFLLTSRTLYFFVFLSSSYRSVVLNPSLIAGPLTFKYDFYGPPNFLYERILEILNGMIFWLLWPSWTLLKYPLWTPG